MSMTLPELILRKYLNPVLVETGTYSGDGVAMALQVGFTQVRSIELDLNQYKKAVSRFREDERVNLWLGDSSKHLWNMIEGVSQPITFWLDAHEFYGVKGDKDCPLMEELEQIARHPLKNHTILIDDRRVFKQWKIDESDLVARIMAINSNYKISYEANTQRFDDVLVAQP